MQSSDENIFSKMMLNPKNDSLENRFLQTFRIAARQAATVARRLEGEVLLRRKAGQRTPEGSALTSVDLANQDLILYLLQAALPEVAVDAEEETESTGLFPPQADGRSLVVIDPVDGTLNYSRGSNDYAVMGALITAGIYRAAVICFPQHNALYWACAGGGCWKETGGAGPSAVGIGRLPPVVLVNHGVPQDLRRSLAETGLSVEVSGCSGVDASAPATGRAAAAVSMGRLGRRRAIGFLMTAEAGGIVRVGPRRWQGEDPARLPEGRLPVVVADSAERADAVQKALDPAIPL